MDSNVVFLDFLEIVNELMEMGIDEDTACQEAYAQLYPEGYDPKDYY